MTTDVYHKIYLDISDFLSSKAGRGAVIYSLESNSNGKVLQQMIRNGIADAAHYTRHSALTIIDHNFFYQPMDKHSSQTLANRLSSTVTMLHNSYGYDNFLLFCKAEKLSKQSDFASNMMFEQQLDSDLRSDILKNNEPNTDKMTQNNNLSIEAICIYKKKFLEARTLNELMKLIRYHTQGVHHQEMSRRALGEYKIIESIRRGFEEILGEGSSRLLFATLKLIYKIDEGRIISDPDVFFEKLNKMIGRNAANKVIPRISQHIISEVLY
jgi:hypothetical protein